MPFPLSKRPRAGGWEKKKNGGYGCEPKWHRLIIAYRPSTTVSLVTHLEDTLFANQSPNTESSGAAFFFFLSPMGASYPFSSSLDWPLCVERITGGLLSWSYSPKAFLRWGALSPLQVVAPFPLKIVATSYRLSWSGSSDRTPFTETNVKLTKVVTSAFLQWVKRTWNQVLKLHEKANLLGPSARLDFDSTRSMYGSAWQSETASHYVPTRADESVFWLYPFTRHEAALSLSTKWMSCLL